MKIAIPRALKHTCSWLALGFCVLDVSTSVAQVSQVDTIRDKHGRVTSTWNRATGDHLWFVYDRSGKLTRKGVEAGQDGDRVLIDTTWNKKGQLEQVFNWQSHEGTSFYYDGRDVLKRKVFSGTLDGQQYNEVTEYDTSGVVRAHYYEAVESKRYAAVFRRDSTYTLYCPDSSIKSVIQYSHGELDGIATDYFWSGAIESIEVYSQGRLMSVQYFDQDGNELNGGDFASGNGTLLVHENGIHVRTCIYKDGYPIKKSCTPRE